MHQYSRYQEAASTFAVQNKNKHQIHLLESDTCKGQDQVEHNGNTQNEPGNQHLFHPQEWDPPEEGFNQDHSYELDASKKIEKKKREINICKG